MRIGIIIAIILALIGLVLYTLDGQAKMKNEIEELKKQIHEMQKPSPAGLLDAKMPSPQKLERSSFEMDPFL